MEVAVEGGPDGVFIVHGVTVVTIILGKILIMIIIIIYTIRRPCAYLLIDPPFMFFWSLDNFPLQFLNRCLHED